MHSVATDADSDHKAALLESVIAVESPADDVDDAVADSLITELLVFPDSQDPIVSSQQKENGVPKDCLLSPQKSTTNKKDSQAIEKISPGSTTASLAEKEALIQTLSLANKKMRRRLRETKRLYSMFMEQRSEVEMLREKVAVAEAQRDAAKAKADLLVSEAKYDGEVPIASKTIPKAQNQLANGADSASNRQTAKVGQSSVRSADELNGDTLADIFNLPPLADDLNTEVDANLAVHLDSNVIGADGMLDLTLTGLGNEYQTSADPIPGGKTTVASVTLNVNGGRQTANCSPTVSGYVPRINSDLSIKTPGGLVSPAVLGSKSSTTLLKSPDTVKELSVVSLVKSVEKRPRDVVDSNGPVAKAPRLASRTC